MNNYYRAKMILENYKKKVKKFHSYINENSGIYVFYRFDEESQSTKVYVGQAKNLLTRIAQHFTEYDHLGKSLHKWGLYDPTNVNGWQIEVKEIAERPDMELKESLDFYEKLYIKKYNYELYNITSGGQGKGKVDINERKQRKGYANGREHGYKDGLEEGTKKGFKAGLEEGKKLGYENCRKEIIELFTKYLTYDIKKSCLKKDGSISEIGKRKLIEFEKFLENR